ncbi:hypothetical protein RKE30_31960 [Streptomyces sp. Li-HN-5-11]|uniref:hypothetical protein n=1 Tax=Streptomyces sp. Li-HN-5-11 TaxID=3075432 RepID=UPI0028AF8137|nr:hypothetical protein [Streptomyces sp. Li-HN-5-11]WNM34659.1 hypothetical protein RKE30_31960 [Streptomyces sp. Li-HN-5-11]
MRLTRPMLAVAGAAAVLALTGCGAGDDAAAKLPPTASGSLESLAAEVKCKPDMQTDADTIRQAQCTTAAGRFILLTYSTDRGQREWLNDAKDYGGFYLVGRKWTISTDRDAIVEKLRRTLGGDVEYGVDHHAHSG